MQAQAEAARVASTLAAELAALDRELLPLLLPALQAYTRAAAAAAASRAVSERDWQAAEAAVCSDLLQLFVTAGCMTAAAAAAGRQTAAALSAWMGGPAAQEQQEPRERRQQQAAWPLLSQHVAGTLRAADRAFLLAAVDRANAGMDATGARPGLQVAASGCKRAVHCCLATHWRLASARAEALFGLPVPGVPSQAWMPWARCWRSACRASRPPAWRPPRLARSCSTPS